MVVGAGCGKQPRLGGRPPLSVASFRRTTLCQDHPVPRYSLGTAIPRERLGITDSAMGNAMRRQSNAEHEAVVAGDEFLYEVKAGFAGPAPALRLRRPRAQPG